MAACNLKIELDTPGKLYVDCDSVTGTIIVQCEKQTKCNALEISTRWVTHGRGNIDSGEGQKIDAFSGVWQAGEQYRYPFELATADWPPTYFGSFLNVSHQVAARAKLSWKSDPKAFAEIAVTATKAPEDLRPKSQQAIGLTKIFLVVLLAVVAVLLLIGLFFIAIIIAIGGAFWWFFRSFLPSQLTGPIVATIEPKSALPNQLLKGHLKFSPRYKLPINEIRCTLTGIECCVSGSGSNSTTHTNNICEHKQVLLAGPTVIAAGTPTQFDFELKLPANAAPSMKLGNNEIRWRVETHLDIPRWPDWSRTFELVVAPSGNLAFNPTEEGIVSILEEPLTDHDGDWFDEVVEQLSQASNNPPAQQVVLDAVAEDRFRIHLTLSTPLSQPPPGQMHDPNCTWYEAFTMDEENVVWLLIPSKNQAFIVDQTWSGNIQIVGYNDSKAIVLAKSVEVD